MKKRYVILLCFTAYWLASAALFADEVHVFGYSYHFDRSDNWCEDNPGLGYTHRGGASLVVFRNSLCNWTGFVNYKHEIADWGWVQYAARAGVFWSEDDYLFGWQVGPALTLEATLYDNYTVSFLGEAMAFHYTWRF